MCPFHRVQLLLVLSLLSACGTVGEAPTRTAPASIADLLEENQPDHGADPVCDWSAADATRLTLASDGTEEQPGVVVDAAAVTLSAGGTWLIDGVLAERALVVDTDEEVRLVLDGVELESASGPALRIEEADQATIVLAADSANRLVDGLSHPEDQEAPGAALASRSDLTLCGAGSLFVEGRHRDGIASSDGLVIEGGHIEVVAVDDGVRGKDYLVVRGGELDIEAGGDALVSDNEEDPERGYVSIEDGALWLTSAGDAVSASTDLLIAGGSLEVEAGGGAGEAVVSSSKGLKAGLYLVIEGGSLAIDAADDALHTDGALVFGGGSAQLQTGDDGLSAGETLHLLGGQVEVEQSLEGMESPVVTIAGGLLHIRASDDGISVSDGTGEAGSSRPGEEVELCDCALFIDGGRVVLTASGDGVDSNGIAELTGGTLIVNGPEGDDGAPDAALDIGQLTISGGLLVSVHMDEMPDEMEGPSTQRYLEASLSTSQAAGTLVHLEDEQGESLLTFAPETAFRALAFSSPQLEPGLHRLYVGGSASGTAEDGLYQDEVYTPGALEAEFTVSSIRTQVGEGSVAPGQRR